MLAKMGEEIGKFESISLRLVSLKSGVNPEHHPDDGSEDDSGALAAESRRIISEGVFSVLGTELLEYAQICNLRRHSV